MPGHGHYEGTKKIEVMQACAAKRAPVPQLRAPPRPHLPHAHRQRAARPLLTGVQLTACVSIFAYIWLLIIVVWSTPGVITLAEAVLTFVFFWIL